jgi:hypothetical protein
MKWTPQKTMTSASVCRCLAGQLQRVANEIGKVLNDWQLVVVSQDDSVSLLAQPIDALNELLLSHVPYLFVPAQPPSSPQYLQRKVSA